MWFCWSIAWINWNGCSGNGIWDACDWVYSHAHLCDCCSPASRYTDWIVQWKMWVRGDHWLTKDLITSRIQQMSRICIALLEFHVSFGYKPGIILLLHPATLKSYNRTHQFVHWRQTLAAVKFFSWFIIRVALTHLSCQLLMSLQPTYFLEVICIYQMDSPNTQLLTNAAIDLHCDFLCLYLTAIVALCLCTTGWSENILAQSAGKCRVAGQSGTSVELQLWHGSRSASTASEQLHSSVCF